MSVLTSLSSSTTQCCYVVGEIDGDSDLVVKYFDGTRRQQRIDSWIVFGGQGSTVIRFDRMQALVCVWVLFFFLLTVTAR